jgi:ABC-type glycerol-3-phosphate transport system substrate-binding protein
MRAAWVEHGGNFMTARRILSLAACAGLAFAAAAPAAAEDASVAKRLDREGLKYEVDNDGDYKLTFNYSKEGRTQLVFVSGTTQTVSGVTVREVFSPAGRVEKDGIDGDKALELMAASGQMKMGSWEIRGDVLYFVIKVLDSATSSELSSLLDIAAETADDKEIELSGDRDDL